VASGDGCFADCGVAAYYCVPHWSALYCEGNHDDRIEVENSKKEKGCP